MALQLSPSSVNDRYADGLNCGGTISGKCDLPGNVSCEANTASINRLFLSCSKALRVALMTLSACSVRRVELFSRPCVFVIALLYAFCISFFLAISGSRSRLDVLAPRCAICLSTTSCFAIRFASFACFVCHTARSWHIFCLIIGLSSSFLLFPPAQRLAAIIGDPKMVLSVEVLFTGVREEALALLPTLSASVTCPAGKLLILGGGFLECISVCKCMASNRGLLRAEERDDRIRLDDS